MTPREDAYNVWLRRTDPGYPCEKTFFEVTIEFRHELNQAPQHRAIYSHSLEEAMSLAEVLYKIGTLQIPEGGIDTIDQIFLGCNGTRRIVPRPKGKAKTAAAQDAVAIFYINKNGK